MAEVVTMKTGSHGGWELDLQRIVGQMESSRERDPKVFYGAENGEKVARTIIKQLDGFKTRLQALA